MTADSGRAGRRQARVIAVAFGIVVLFLVAQVAWWLIFQHRYIGRLMRSVEADWVRDAAVATAAASSDPSLVPTMLAAYPHLSHLGEGRFVVNQRSIDDFMAGQRSHLRMFWFEGGFFVLVTLSGLWILARSLAAARELRSRQGNFLLAVTHELKTPLSTLRLLVETMRYRQSPSPKQSDYLRRMDRELHRMEQSTQRVLASARLEQGSVVRLQEAELNSTVQGIVGKTRPGLETSGARLRVDYSPDRLPVEIDPEALEIAVTNLLDNAVKYSPEDEKPVRIALRQSDGWALIAIEDEGVGVPRGEAGRIFERFYRPGSEMTRRSQGMGLGLHLVRSNVEAMGGRVSHEANDAAGRGARFVIALPLGRPLPEEAEVGLSRGLAAEAGEAVK